MVHVTVGLQSFQLFPPYQLNHFATDVHALTLIVYRPFKLGFRRRRRACEYSQWRFERLLRGCAGGVQICAHIVCKPIWDFYYAIDSFIARSCVVRCLLDKGM